MDRFLFRLGFNSLANSFATRASSEHGAARRSVCRIGDGLFWSVIHPLVLLASYTFVFSVVLKQPLGESTGTASFAIHLFCGILPWLVFQETLSRSSTVLIENSNLITKTLFPSEILPVSVLLANLVNHFIGLAIFLLVAILYLQKLSWLLLLVPVYLLALSLFALGLSWFVSASRYFFGIRPKY
jgi:ABC-type polysaccharide/polyol phosphate export permease